MESANQLIIITVKRAKANHIKAVAAYKGAKEAFDELSSSLKNQQIVKWTKQEAVAKKAKGKALQNLYTASVKNKDGIFQR